MKITGRPLSELGLENARIIDAEGNDAGPLEGFIAYPNKTLEESIRAFLPPGYTVSIPPRTH